MQSLFKGQGYTEHKFMPIRALFINVILCKPISSRQLVD